MINTENMKLTDKITEEENELAIQVKEAVDFISKMQWCIKVIKGYVSLEVEGILTILFFEIEPIDNSIDRFLWVIVGDIPPAYIVTDKCPNAQCALNAYIYEMCLWVDAVKNNKSIDDLIPVNVPPKKKYAEMLEKRLIFIKNEILIEYKNDLEPYP